MPQWTTMTTTSSVAYLDEAEDLLELEALFGRLPRRLDERVDEQRVLGDPLRHKEDALGDALLLAERIHGAAAGKGGKLAVFLHHLLVEGDGLLVPGAELAVERTELIAQRARELESEHVLDGRHHGVLPLAVTQTPQKLQVVVEQLLEAREDAVDRLCREPQLPPHPLRKDLYRTDGE